MEFHEKLQKLRKAKGMTQEELAEILYVSRTAISKWESGRGYPSLDSLKEISKFFTISIDDLLSCDTLLSIAEKDNKYKMNKIYDLIHGVTDLFALALIVLPLYPQAVEGYVYAVNLIVYTTNTSQYLYWAIYIAFIILGGANIFLLKHKKDKQTELVSDISMGMNVLALIFLVVSRETYAAVIMIVMLIVKVILHNKKI